MLKFAHTQCRRYLSPILKQEWPLWLWRDLESGQSLSSYAKISVYDRIEYLLPRRWYLNSLELAHVLVDAILDKKGSNIILLDLQEQSLFADYFLICSGENQRQIRALAEALRTEAKKEAGIVAQNLEGTPEAGWILVDFDDLIVHVFAPDKRHYYDLEELWADAHVVLRMP